MPESRATGAHAAGTRVARNTAFRAIGEALGKLASLALFAVLGRSIGQSGLGAFVFAFAVLQIAMVPVDLGYDRYLIRRFAREPAAVHHLLADVVALKLMRAVPILALTVAGLWLLGEDTRTLSIVAALMLGVIADSLSRSLFSVFTGLERGDMLALALVVQRVLGAALGLAALALGYGVVTVAATYSIAAVAGAILAAGLVRRVAGGLPRRVDRRNWKDLTRSSLPFATQDVFTVLLFKVDAVILAALATEAAVGRYGAAYRLFESTLFLTFALGGAFAPMYTYLGPDTDPSIRAVFGRSVKACAALLVPVGVAFTVLAEPLCRLLFGEDFATAARPLRLLGPVVPLIGIVTLSSSLVVSRRDPRAIVGLTAVMAGANVLLNLALIPSLVDTGAALAMLITEVLFCAAALRMAAATTGGLPWMRTLAGPLLAGAAMAAAMIPLADRLVLGAVAGSLVYLLVLFMAERAISPGDLRFAATLVRRREPGQEGARR